MAATVAPTRNIKLTLKEDLVIPAGTEFKRGPQATEYAGNNYEAIIGLTPDNTADFMVYLEDDIEDMFDVDQDS